MRGASTLILHPVLIRSWGSGDDVFLEERLRCGFPEHRSRFSVIHSRVSPSSSSGDPWVSVTRNILDRLDISEMVLVTGFGRLQFDYPLYLWLKKGGSAVAVADDVCPGRCSLQEEKRYQWFFRHPGLSWIIIGNPQKRRRPTRRTRLFRDRVIASVCHFLVPGVVRPGGNMSKLLEEFSKISDVRCFDGESPEPMPETEAFRSIPMQFSKRVFPKDYIWHYTRGRHEPWPEDGWEMYLEGLSSQEERVPYSSFDALKRILLKRWIYPSGRLIRGQIPVVCFSQNDPVTMHRLFHWQRHLRRRRFTPYAIGLRKSIAFSRGIRPVIYGSGEIFSVLPKVLHFRFQRYEPPDVDWLEEGEWRYRGGFDFSAVSLKDIIVLTASRSEVLELRRFWAGSVICLE